MWRSSLLLLGLLVLFGALMGWATRLRAPTPLAHEAYVWQRSWNESLAGAVTESRARLSGILCLAAEITAEPDGLQLRRVEVDHDALRGFGGSGPVAVLRIFPSVAAGGWSPETRTSCDDWIRKIIGFFVDLSGSVLERPRTVG